MATPKHDPFSELQKKNLDAAMHLTQISMENTQKVVELQVDTAKAIFEDTISAMRAMTEAKDGRAAMEIRNKVAQSATERIMSCGRKIADITANTQNEVGRIVSEQFTSGSADMVDGIQRMMQGMPLPGTETMNTVQSAMDSARGAVEQMTKASQEAFSSLTNITTRAAGAATKTATAAIVEPFTPRVAGSEAAEHTPSASVGGKRAGKGE